jgi:hypothetical protein
MLTFLKLQEYLARLGSQWQAHWASKQLKAQQTKEKDSSIDCSRRQQGVLSRLCMGGVCGLWSQLGQAR